MEDGADGMPRTVAAYTETARCLPHRWSAWCLRAAIRETSLHPYAPPGRNGGGHCGLRNGIRIKECTHHDKEAFSLSHSHIGPFIFFFTFSLALEAVCGAVISLLAPIMRASCDDANVDK